MEIAVSSGGLDGLLDIETYEVEEGGVVKLIINTTNIVNFLSSESIGLRSPVLKGVLSSYPQYGVLCVGSQCPATEFTNEQMNNGAIEYTHDHSDSGYDNVTLTVYLEQDNITLCNVTIHLIINPINDQPFHLVQEAPSLTVVQSERYVLTQDQLLTTDKDTLPEDIEYALLNGPSIGSVYVNGVRGAGKFTQADVNAGRVVYEHSGPVQSSSFHFRVSDGKFTPTYKVFNIFVHAAKLNVSVRAPVFITQSSNTTVIESDAFHVQTNYKEKEVAYRIVTPPRFGYISVNGAKNATFSQSEVRSRRVLYVQTDLSVAGDTFELEASLPYAVDSKVKNLWINISVEPLLKVDHKFSPVVGGRTCINNEVLNADALAKLSKSNPTFTVLKKPKYGKIQKIIRRNRGNREIDTFTYEEVISKVIYYVAARKVNFTAGAEDGFAFLLQASRVQPAIGELKFNLRTESAAAAAAAAAAGARTTGVPPKQKSFSQSKTRTTSRAPPLSASEVGDVEIASPNMTNDDYYFVSLLFGILIVSLLFVIFVRCRSKKRAEEDMKMNPPLPLPRPPDDLMPSSPYPKRNNMSMHSTPQCKVIPLGTDSVTSSEHDFNLRYPYGAADEDWSSYDTSGYSTRNNNNNPMLRKNQYWV